MEIIIIDVAMLETERRVTFQSRCGRGDGSWDGPQRAIGDGRFVEPSIGSPVGVGADLVETDAPTGLAVEAGATVIVGNVIESYLTPWDFKKRYDDKNRRGPTST
jgi:hypothetical protein